MEDAERVCTLQTCSSQKGPARLARSVRPRRRSRSAAPLCRSSSRWRSGAASRTPASVVMKEELSALVEIPRTSSAFDRDRGCTCRVLHQPGHDVAQGTSTMGSYSEHVSSEMVRSDMAACSDHAAPTHWRGDRFRWRR